jgi:protein-disulfide isomerase
LATLALIMSASLSWKGGTMADCCGGSSSAVKGSNNPSGKMPPIEYEKVPMIGSPDASYIVNLLFDYQCSQCQKIHFMLNEVVRQYKGRMAIVLFPAPLNSECNTYIHRNVDGFKNSCELARISLSVWLANREAFPAFEDWMFMYESGDSWQPRNPETSREKAVELVGQTKFDEAYSDPWIRQYMQTSTQIYGQTIQNGMGGIPKMIFGPVWVIPQPDNAEGLIRILQQNLAVPLP